MWSHTYLTMVKGAHISFHFFSDNIGEPWLRKPMDSATKSAIVEALRAIAEEAEAKRRFSMMCFPSFLEWCQPQIIPD